MSMAMVGDTVLEEAPAESTVKLEPELVLLASARAEAIETLAELHRIGSMSAAAADMRERPGYWLGRLEGVIIGLAAASDEVVESLAAG